MLRISTLVLFGALTLVSRSFEAHSQERATGGNLNARGGAAPRDGRQIQTPHLIITTGISADAVVPGSRFSLVLDVVPKPRMHVYAPQQADYIPISLTLESNDAITPHAPRFPAPERFFFKPLKETQLVYSRRFRIVQDLTVGQTLALRERAKADDAELKIKGVLRYQACDDTICYLPKDVPMSWVVRLKRPER
ncbi:MAG: protein-disulfide reductase DsbD N-terminal domain-containing protein [Acidobacteria bacterium]|nr:protein-disulfide reductase DsbD N-terminal domain-containing protein [Acidobacteriota bacterium]